MAEAAVAAGVMQRGGGCASPVGPLISLSLALAAFTGLAAVGRAQDTRGRCMRLLLGRSVAPRCARRYRQDRALPDSALVLLSGGHEFHEKDSSGGGSFQRPGGGSGLPGEAHNCLCATVPCGAHYGPHRGSCAHTVTKLAMEHDGVICTLAALTASVLPLHKRDGCVSHGAGIHCGFSLFQGFFSCFWGLMGKDPSTTRSAGRWLH